MRNSSTQNVQSFPSLEGRTISMALAIAPDVATPAGPVFQEAGCNCGRRRRPSRARFHLFGRTLEWKRLNDAEELKSELIRLVRDFGFPPDLHQRSGFRIPGSVFSARAAARRKRCG